jgi:hypothetical protein
LSEKEDYSRKQILKEDLLELVIKTERLSYIKAWLYEVGILLVSLQELPFLFFSFF